jgi:heat shock protein HtpX
MPFTFVEIEERTTRTLTLLFAAVLGLYVVSVIALVWGVRLLLGYPAELTVGQLLAMLGVALAAALLHWAVSTPWLVDRVLAAVLARPLDPADTYHARLRNIVEEVTVATGGRHRIEPCVIPTPAMNACAVADFSGRAAIAVTEGLLARLTRAQLEAVVGHEAAHIASGDSLTSSVFVGLFGLHEEALKRLTGLLSGRAGWRVRGRGAAILLFVTVVLWLTNTTKRLCELLISRQQEYRADATAVRLTRDPLALAEALHLINRRWRGVGMPGESLSTIFIVDTGLEPLSEREGMAADWFSTHPPTERRIALLLGMSHVPPDGFERLMAERARQRRPRELVPPVESKPSSDAAPRWFVRLGDAWQGPLGLEELMGLDGLTPDSWVRREGEDGVQPAHRDAEVLTALRGRYGQAAGAQPLNQECPNCRLPLVRVLYEGVPLDRCPACGGCSVRPDQMTRIFAREDYAFPESVKRLAKTMPGVYEARRLRARPSTRGRSWPTAPSDPVPYQRRLEDRRCPTCRSAVIRKFYTEAYLVEVEQCWVCGLTWLDQDELELLQYLYEEAQRREETLEDGA